MRVELRDEALDDLVDGALFYRQQAPGLDAYFLEGLRADLQKLETTFGIHEKYCGYYRSLSKRFPFAIYYQLTDETVEVVAILDCRQDPQSTIDRIGRGSGS